MNKALKISLIVVGSLAGLVILATLLVSPIGKKYVNSHGEQLIGRKISVDKLKVNVYGGHVAINNLKVYEDDKTTEFLTIDTLDVKMCIRKLLGHKIDVRHITLANLGVKVIQDGDRFNFSSILDHFAPEEEEPEMDTTPSKPWELAFSNIRLSHWKVYYSDKQRGSDWDLKDLNIEVPGVYFNGEENTDAGLTLALADGGTLNTNVGYNLESNDFTVDLNLADFAISNARAYLTDAMNVGKIEGLLDGQFKVRGNLSELLKMAISGDLELKEVDIQDNQNRAVLSLKELTADVNDIVLDDNRFDIAEVVIDGLKSHFDNLPNGSNFAQFFDVPKTATEPEEEPEPDTTSTTEGKPMKLKVGRFQLKDAEFTYNDQTLPDPFSFPVTHINIEANNVDLSGTNAAHITAQLPHDGRALIDWQGTLNDIKQYQHLVLNIRNIQLSDISPYSVAYLGQPFTNGTFSFTSDNKIQQSQLEGKNRIDMYKPEVGEKRKDVDSALHLPLKAALYVLKDKDDKVILDVPISGNIDSPEFSYMKAVWKTLSNLFVKVATSPMRAIGNALGISSDGLEFIEIDPEQEDFTSEQYYLLGQLADIANYDSSVHITMVQQLSTDTDEATLQKADRRNEAVMQHLSELGSRLEQFTISTEQVEKQKKSGYAITTELIEEAEE